MSTPDHPGGDDGESGAIDLDAKACPTCLRPLEPWQDDCEVCREPAVLRFSLPPALLPAVPTHLRDAVDDDGGAVTAAGPAAHKQALAAFEAHEEQPVDGPPEPPPVGGVVFFPSGVPGCDGGGAC